MDLVPENAARHSPELTARCLKGYLETLKFNYINELGHEVKSHFAQVTVDVPVAQ